MAFLTGALAFWMPTFLSRAQVTQGIRPPCIKEPCDPTDRCSMTFDLHLPSFTQLLSKSLQRCCLPLLTVQLHLRRGDGGDGHSGSESWHWFIQMVSEQVAKCGPAHLCSRHAGIGSLPLCHHICGLRKYSSDLCKRHELLFNVKYINYVNTPHRTHMNSNVLVMYCDTLFLDVSLSRGKIFPTCLKKCRTGN